MSSKRYKIKKKVCSIEPNCSKEGCENPSTDFFFCSSCKSPYHLTCSSIDPDLIPMLERNTSKGLTWYVHCENCVETNLPDPISLHCILLEISTSISKKVDEFKNLIGMSSLLNIGTDLSNKVDDFKSSIEKAGLVSTARPINDCKSIEVQTDDRKSFSTTAIQTIDSSRTNNYNLSSLSNTDNYQAKYTNPPRSKVCLQYKRGRCIHGSRGDFVVDGKKCPFSHPPKCLNFCRYGNEGCSGPCNYLHPFICKSSIDTKVCLNSNCTFAHLAGTRRHSSSFSNTEYGEPEYSRPTPPYISSSNRNQNPAMNNQREPYSQISKQPDKRRRFHYTENDFPPLPTTDDTKYTKISDDVSKLQQSVSFILQNIAITPKITTGNFPQMTNNALPQNSSATVPATLYANQAESSKNYMLQNNQYPVK